MALRSDAHYVQNRKRAEELAAQTKERDAQRQDAEYQHRATPNRRRDDDEFRAMCGVGGGPNLSNPPMRRY